MKYPTLLRSFALLFVLGSTSLLRASEADTIAAVRAADDERVAATMAADAARMDAVYSADLSYTHSNGKHDTKKSYLESVTKHSTVYTGYEYKQRDFFVATPDIVVESAHVVITAGATGKPAVNDLNIMAVWRHEGGKWRFLSWLSAKIPAPVAPAAK